MKHFFLAICTTVAFALSASAGYPRIYGIRIASDIADARQALVSFSATSPDKITIEADLSDLMILAAAASTDGTYYFITSADGIVPSSLYSFSLETRKTVKITDYDWRTNRAGSLLIQDMTFDPNRGKLYAIAFDLSKAEMVNDEIDAPFGLFAIDPATGETSEVGTQESAVLMTLAANSSQEWLSIDNFGTLWLLSDRNGAPDVNLLSTGIIPSTQQSMSFDLESGICYWASVEAEAIGDSTINVSRLHALSMTPDREWTIESIGHIADNSRLIGLWVDSNPANASAPGAPLSVSATAADFGALTATVRFTIPTATYGGQPLAAEGLMARIYRDNEAAVEIAVAPGQSVSWVDNDPTTGLHTYSASCFNEAGEGIKAYASEIFVGIDSPGAPGVVTAALNGTTAAVSLQWQTPTEGAHGGWFDESAITYNVTRRPDGKSVATGTSRTSATDNGFADLHGYIYEVVANTPAGSGPAALSAPVIAGPAINPPYASDFNDPDRINLWTVVNADADNYTWYPNYEMWGGTSDVFFRYNPAEILSPETSVDDWLFSPPIALEEGKYYRVEYQVRLLGDLFPATTALILASDAKPEATVMTLEFNEADVNDITWTPHTLTFLASRSDTYRFGYRILNAVPVQWYGFKVSESSAVDLAVSSFKSPALAVVGAPCEFTVEVDNHGVSDAESYQIEIIDQNDNLLCSLSINQLLKSGADAVHTLSWTPDASGNLNVSARIVVTDDFYINDNLSYPRPLPVLPDCSTAHITDGTTGSGYAPFYASYRHSTVQTIYTPEELNISGEGAFINALVYYIYSLSVSCPTEVSLQVSLANVDKPSFYADETQMIPESAFTKVFDGVVPISADKQEIAIVLDRDFHYTGGNLCVMTSHMSPASPYISLVCKARYVGSDDCHTLLYRHESKPFDFTQSVSAYRDRPNLSVYHTDSPSSSIHTPGNVADTESTIFDLTGRRLKSTSTTGVYIINGHKSISLW